MFIAIVQHLIMSLWNLHVEYMKSLGVSTLW